MIIVSACLLGLKTKYDGKANTHALLQKYCARGKFIPVMNPDVAKAFAERDRASLARQVQPVFDEIKKEGFANFSFTWPRQLPSIERIPPKN